MLIIGDLQIDSPSEYNYGAAGNYILEGSLRTLRYCFDYAKQQAEQTIFILGDIHALKDKLPNRIKNPLIDLFEEYYQQFEIITLVGNHDYLNGELAIKYLKPYMHVIEKPDIITIVDQKVVCIPYYTDVAPAIEALLQYDVDLLLGHFFVSTSLAGRFDKQAMPLNTMNRFKRVILGHDHIFQRLSTNVTVLGSIYQEDWGEVGQKKYIAYGDNGFHKLPLYIDRQDIVLGTGADIEEIMAFKPDFSLNPDWFHFRRIICTSYIDPEKLRQLQKFYLSEGAVKVVVMPYSRDLKGVNLDVSKGKDLIVQTMVEKALQDIPSMYQRFIAKQVLNKVMERI